MRCGLGRDRPARLESALVLERLKFVFLGLGRHVARLGFVCLLGAILVGGLFLPLIVQNDTVSLFVFWHHILLQEYKRIRTVSVHGPASR